MHVRPRLKASSKLMFPTTFDKTSYGKDIKPNIRPFRGNRIADWPQEHVNYMDIVVCVKEKDD